MSSAESVPAATCSICRAGRIFRLLGHATRVSTSGSSLWIRPKEAARRVGDIFYHGRERDAAWSPDVLVTMQAVTDQEASAIVVDAKYTRDVKDEHWQGVRKYMQIRRLADDGFPVRQVWIAAPSSAGSHYTTFYNVERVPARTCRWAAVTCRERSV